MPLVSIVLPTYNRADTIRRAVGSVLRQSFANFELLVVDDGSADDTASLVLGLDPRVRLIRQPNQGCYIARNTGLQHSRGRFVAFLDSDDEWLPHFLEITIGFLEASPQDHFVTTESLWDFGDPQLERHDIAWIVGKYVPLARAVGSRALQLPPGETDDYLRVYETHEPLGAWGARIAERAGYPNAQLYRGHILDHMRWGYLNWLPITVLTRQALEVVGPFSTRTRSGADYRFLALLCRHFRANMIAVPGAIRHECTQDGRPLAQGHLATGLGAYSFAVNRLSFFDELFWTGHEHERETLRLRAHYLAYAARTALKVGKRAEALRHLQDAGQGLPRSWELLGMKALLRSLPSGRIAAIVYKWVQRLADRSGRLVSRGEPLGRAARRILPGLRLKATTARDA